MIGFNAVQACRHWRAAGMIMRKLRRLVVVSHVAHHRCDGRLYAYGPYAREIDIWADLFPEVVVAAPCRQQEPPGDCVAFMRENISIRPQLQTGGTTVGSRLVQVLLLPLHFWNLSRAMARADAIHVRCPGNLGLIGVALAPLFSRFLVAKYAGQWNGYAGEPFSVRLQRSLLRSRWWRGPVTVYGQWPNQPAHVVPFFTSVLTEQQMQRARRSAAAGRGVDRLRIVFVGRLSKAKNVDTLLSALGLLKQAGVSFECTIIGEGPERRTLEEQSSDCGLASSVTFAGGLPFEKVLQHYEAANVLVLVSETEGWPKAITEAMAFGLVCIGSNRGLLPQILGEGRGLLAEPGDAKALSDALRWIAANAQESALMSKVAAKWAQQFFLEGLRQALKELLERHWGCVLASPSTLRANSAAVVV